MYVWYEKKKLHDCRMYWLVLAGHCSPVVRWSGGAEARAARVSRDHIRWRTRVAEEA